MLGGPSRAGGGRRMGQIGYESPLAGHGNRLIGGAQSTPRSPAGIPQSDGSFSVVKDEDEANNSGLLDLAPNYGGMIMARGAARGGRAQQLGRSGSSNVRGAGRNGFGSPLGLGALLKKNGPPNLKDRFEKTTSVSALLNKGKRKAEDEDEEQEQDPQQQEEQNQDSSIRETGSVIEHSLGADGNDETLEDAMVNYDYGYQFEIDDVDRAQTELAGAQTELAAKLRKWRQEAYGAHKYEMAIFWGDKVLAFESE